jgi:hypothetical protein
MGSDISRSHAWHRRGPKHSVGRPRSETKSVGHSPSTNLCPPSQPPWRWSCAHRFAILDHPCALAQGSVLAGADASGRHRGNGEATEERLALPRRETALELLQKPPPSNRQQRSRSPHPRLLLRGSGRSWNQGPRGRSTTTRRSRLASSFGVAAADPYCPESGTPRLMECG